MAFFHFTIPFLVLLGVLIFVHELGHFIVAKRLGIRVLKFSLGFGPPLLSRQRGDTEYAVSAIPLGGYVKLFGEDPDEELPAGDAAASFSGRPVRHRIATVLAGPFMNFLLAVVVFGILGVVGAPVLQPVVGEVASGMPAETAGIRTGDRIEAVEGREVGSWEAMAEAIGDSRAETIEVRIRRGEEIIALRVTPVRKTSATLLGEMVERPMIGVSPAGAVETQRHPAWMAPWIGVRETGRWTWTTVEVLGKMVMGRVSPRNLGGPIAIAQMAGETARAGLVSFLFLVAVLSVNLGVLNLLPIPVLDGGHVLFFGIEALRGKAVSIRHREIAQQVGLAILIALMVYVIYNDVTRLVSG